MNINKLPTENKDLCVRIPDILYKISTGEVENKIKFIIKKIDDIEIPNSVMVDLVLLKQDISGVETIVKEWEAIPQ